MRARTLLLVLILSTAMVAGCTDPATEPVGPPPRLLGDLPREVGSGLERLAALRAEPLVLDRPFTVHVVTVGWDLALLDQEAIRQALPADTSPRIEFSDAPGGYRGSLMHQIDYAFHQAPDGFAEELFGGYAAFTQEVPLPGGEAGFLARYDRMYDLGRTPSGTMRLVDAQAAEEHLNDLRAKHDLLFEGPHATLFLLDSWTEQHLEHDTFYWYSFGGDSLKRGEHHDLRAFGGTYDFLFLDRSAAPNDATTDESGITKAYYVLGSQPVYAPEGTAYNDPPAWHYDGATATIGTGPSQRTLTASDATIATLDPAINLRFLSGYVFRPVYPDRFQVNVHVWHDGRSIVPTDDLDALILGDTLKASLQAAIPWVPVDVVVKTYLAPRDDPGMHAALQQAKAEAAGGTAAMPVLLNHVEAHRDQYGANEPGVFDVMALGFILEGHMAVVAPGASGGAAVTGADNQCWGTTSSANDMKYLQERRDIQAVAAFLSRISDHEVAHCFGLPHAHDGSRRTPDGYGTALDHTWSSTNTTMSYRLDTYGLDHLHRASVARAHVHDAVGQTLRELDWTYRALDADGEDRVPSAIHSHMQRALDKAEEALSLYDAGADIDAAYAAVAGHRIAQDAYAAAGGGTTSVVDASWERSGVHHVGAKNSAFVFRPGVSAPEILHDYQQVTLGPDAERVTVRATWTNTQDSWGDFFVGWRAPDILDPIFIDLAAAGGMITLGTGIHDVDEEGPGEGDFVREFTLELDHFPALRKEGVVFEAGAGSIGMAVNGAYEVEVVVERRVG